ncbi:hypothetical protein GCM10020000_76260 [Streptomyces olivoverticillatus]
MLRGDVVAARLQHGEQRDDQVGRALLEDGDRVLAAGAELGQAGGEGVGAGVQLGVGQFGAAVDHGDRVRGAPGLGREQVGQAAVRDRAGGVVPLLQKPLLLVADQVEAADGQLRLVGRGLEQYLEAAGEGRGRRLVEQLAVELQVALDAAEGALAVPVGDEVEGEVELGDAEVHGLAPYVQAGQARFGVGLLVGEHHLEQRVAGGRAHGLQPLHDAVEGHVLVGVRAQGGRAHPGQQLAEGGVAGGVGAQHDGVDEEADEVVERRVVAAEPSGSRWGCRCPRRAG